MTGSGDVTEDGMFIEPPHTITDTERDILKRIRDDATASGEHSVAAEIQAALDAGVVHQ